MSTKYEEYCGVADNEVRKDDAVYATAHDAAEGSLWGVTKDNMYIGQRWQVTVEKYLIHRSFIQFDTSSIPSNSNIIYAKLRLGFQNVHNDNNFDIVIRNGMPTYPHSPVEVGDYLYSHYSGDGGSVNSYGLATDDYTDIILNTTGHSWIQTGDSAVTKFALISSRDISEAVPAANGDTNEFVSCYTSNNATFRPTLIVLYDPPTAISVSTKNVSNVESDYLTANGKVNFDGGFTVSKRGFQYGLTETATWTVQDTGEFTTPEDYSKIIIGLTEGTVYYIRAFAENTNSDAAYGSWVKFTAGDKYGIYEEDNAATICFYVRTVGGKWSIKHGPYTTDQADIEITKILTEGKGKYQIKFESDVLTGISAGVMCKVDIKAR